jgi:lipopolysaccharide transport system ATP-binding protein
VTVENLCPRALLLVDGQLVFDGPTKETVAQYMRVLPHAEPGLTPGVFELSAADRSGGDYEEVFKRLEFRPGGGAPSNTIRMGERLRIEILVEGLDAVPDPVVALMVGSSGTPTLFRMNSRMIPLDAAHVRRSVETIVLDVPSLPLTPGNYQVHMQLWDNERTVDYVHLAAEFTVAPSDIFGNGYQFRSNDGAFFVPWSWEVRPSTADCVTSNLTSPVQQ